jgi:hypothetical protein
VGAVPDLFWRARMAVHVLARWACPHDQLRFATLGREFGIQVSVRYSRKDTITALLIDPYPSSTHLPVGIEHCVQEALDGFTRPERFYLQAPIELYKPFTFHPYSTSRWRLLPSVPGRALLTLCVHGFDRLDAEFDYLMRVQPVLDQLATLTNCVLTLSKTTEKVEAAEVDRLNTVFNP